MTSVVSNYNMLIFFNLSRNGEELEALDKQKPTSLDFLKKLFDHCAKKGVVGRTKVREDWFKDPYTCASFSLAPQLLYVWISFIFLL